LRPAAKRVGGKAGRRSRRRGWDRKTARQRDKRCQSRLDNARGSKWRCEHYNAQQSPHTIAQRSRALQLAPYHTVTSRVAVSRIQKTVGTPGPDKLYLRPIIVLSSSILVAVTSIAGASRSATRVISSILKPPSNEKRHGFEQAHSLVLAEGVGARERHAKPRAVAPSTDRPSCIMSAPTARGG
jgi:hypothetical protein